MRGQRRSAGDVPEHLDGGLAEQQSNIAPPMHELVCLVASYLVVKYREQWGLAAKAATEGGEFFARFLPAKLHGHRRCESTIKSRFLTT